MKRKFIRIIVSLIIFLFLIFTGAYLYLVNSWRSEERIEIVKAVAEKVQRIPPMPDSLFSIYKAVYPEKVGMGMHSDISDKIWNGFINNKPGKNLCSCDDIIFSERLYYAVNIFPFTSLEALKIGFGLEQYVGSEKCLNYFIRSSYDEIQSGKGLYSWHNKKLDSLTIEEFKEFLVLEKAPVYYDKFRHPATFKARLKVINERIQKNSLSHNY